MCGIFGITNTANKDVPLEALKSFKYRGPDHTGFLFDSGVFMGTNRLSIIDLDPRSHQPFISEDKDISLVFNGEIFNYKELQRELMQQGYSFKTDSDTEVILNLYKCYGTPFVNKLRGMFAIAIFDRSKNKILLFKDHVGIKPLYYCVEDTRLIFSSELKGITKIKKDATLSRQSFALATVLGYVPSPLTVYQEIKKLESGSLLTYDLSTNRYSIEHIFELPQSTVSEVSTLSDLIEEKILSHLVGDVPVGLFFSGGTDSSLIAAILKKHKISLNAYSITMDNKKEDAFYIDEIGKEFGLNLKKEFFGMKEFDDRLASFITLIDEPTHDSSLLAINHLSNIAASEVKVVLSGEGADEFYYGYARHHVLSKMPEAIPRGHPLLGFLYAQNIITKGKRSIFLKLATLLKDPYLYYIVATGNGGSNKGWDEWKQWFQENQISPMELDQKIYLENDLLRKMDLATSYASIEGRVPFLDPDIISASCNFSHVFKEGDMLKPVLKKVLTNYLPSKYVYRGKSGLGLPVREFFLESRLFRGHLTEALAHLGSIAQFKGLMPNWSGDDLIRKEPYQAFLLLSYYYTIKNTV